MTQLIRLVSILFISFNALASVPHMELELTSQDYKNLIGKHLKEGAPRHILTPVMDMGKKNLDWVKYINDHREPANQISLTSPATQPAYPVDSPRISNPTLILEEYNKIQSELPGWFKAILFENAPFTVNPPVSDETYIKLGIRVDRSYQRAARWILQEPYLESYAERKTNDVRGYYYFNQDPSHKEKLPQWQSLSKEEQNRYSLWLRGMCENKGSGLEKECHDKLLQELSSNQNPVGFFKTYYPIGEEKWNGFFSLNVKRPDVEWAPENPGFANAAFLEPASTGAKEIKTFLIQNIEDEWKWGPWQLKLDFKPSGDFPKIVFEPGATPHVNGLGGNTITMDANQPLTEYDVRWTIRHEYGHVLGFPDCYVEFYDKTQQAMISYQLDITNLMCSRRGHLKETHYLEMKKIYLP